MPDVAQAFQQAGVTALIYDGRCTGESDGLPRQEIDPRKLMEDYSDALTFMRRQTCVDPARIALWGFSFTGMIALNAAALDKRAKSVIAVCPLTDFSYGGRKAKVLTKAIKDRESQLQGNEPFTLPVLTEQGQNPAGFGVGTAEEDFKLILSAEKTAPNYKNFTTLQTYYHIAAWQPFGNLPMISCATLMLTPENDRISLAENQGEIFGTISGRKKQHIEPGKGHMDILSGDSFARLMAMQCEFLNGM